MNKKIDYFKFLQLITIFFFVVSFSLEKIVIEHAPTSPDVSGGYIYAYHEKTLTHFLKHWQLISDDIFRLSFILSAFLTVFVGLPIIIKQRWKKNEEE